MCLTFIITQCYNHSILFSIIVHFSLGLVYIKLIIKIIHRKKTKQTVCLRLRAAMFQVSRPADKELG